MGRNMNAFIAALLVIATVVYSDAASLPGTCTNSYDCSTSMCCRDQNSGNVISDQQLGGFGHPFLQPGGHHVNGTCSTRKAQKGELCDSHCQCDTGLMCYRPMSGVCCPPRQCYDEAYVKQQQHYWSNCMKDP